MTTARAFRGYDPAEVILWAVRWYLQFPISYCDLERMLADRGVAVDHTTMYHWVKHFAPELERRTRRHLRPCRGPWHVEGTLQVDSKWRYLYRAVDGTGQTIDFLLSAKRDKKAAKRFFRKALGRDNTRNPREIVTDRLKSYPGALREMKREGELWRFTRHRRGRWLDNLVEQDHRRIKRRTGPMLGFQSFGTARRTLAGVEAMAMLAKGQVRAVPATTCRRSGRSFIKPSASGGGSEGNGLELACNQDQRNGTEDLGRETIAAKGPGRGHPRRSSCRCVRGAPLLTAHGPPLKAMDPFSLVMAWREAAGGSRRDGGRGPWGGGMGVQSLGRGDRTPTSNFFSVAN